MRNSKILKLITTLFLIGVIFKCIFMAEGISGKMWFSWKRSKAARNNTLNRYKNFENKFQTTTSHTRNIIKENNYTCSMKKKKSNFRLVNNSKSRHRCTYNILIVNYIISFALQNLALKLFINE